MLGIVQTIADNKRIWKRKSSIICFKINRPACRLVEQGYDTYRIGITILEQFNQMCQRQALSIISSTIRTSRPSTDASKSLMILMIPEDFVDAP